MLVWRQRLCKKIGKRTSSVNNWKEWKVVQAKKTGNRKKDVFVPILFLYFGKYLYKILIHNVLLYSKITFSRYINKKTVTMTPKSQASCLHPFPEKERSKWRAKSLVKRFIFVLSLDSFLFFSFLFQFFSDILFQFIDFFLIVIDNLPFFFFLVQGCKNVSFLFQIQWEYIY